MKYTKCASVLIKINHVTTLIGYKIIDLHICISDSWSDFCLNTLKSIASFFFQIFPILKLHLYALNLFQHFFFCIDDTIEIRHQFIE